MRRTASSHLDTLSPLVDVAFHLENPSFVDAWIGCLAYSLQRWYSRGYPSAIRSATSGGVVSSIRASRRRR